jgi:hypothetical protein
MCKINGCNLKQRRKGLCNKHYAEYRGFPCSVEGCNEFSVGKNLCSLHWQRKKANLPMDYKKNKKTYISSDGYVVEYMPGHIQADKGGKVLQHRRLYSDLIGRRLHSYENIHHKNGDRKDNRIENLELWVKRQPSGQRVEDLVKWAKWILLEYNNDASKE